MDADKVPGKNSSENQCAALQLHHPWTMDDDDEEVDDLIGGV